MIAKEDKTMYSIPFFNTYPNLVYGISTPDDGNMMRQGNPNYLLNRIDFLAKYEIAHDSRVFIPGLNHGTNVLRIGPGINGHDVASLTNPVYYDLVVNNTRGVTLGMTAADCPLLLAYDPRKHATAMAHSGYRGTNLEIARLLVREMNTAYGSEPKDILIGISPSISPQHFSMETRGPNLQNPGWNAHLEIKEGRFHFDIAGFIRDQLTSEGILPSHIYTVPIDTFVEGPSFRRDGDKSERFLGFIRMK
jgi:copper oxidase (laccase) domain-containing protein